MNYQLYGLRRRHGDTYLTKLLDGTEVPWRPLSIKEFIEYEDLFLSKIYPVAQLEDEIFTKCCLDLSLIENLDALDAGIISTTVTHIMDISGPTLGTEQIAYDLNYARHKANNFFSQSVTIICQVFPGYTPEKVYALDYRVFMERLAMAEQRMLELGLMQEPIKILEAETGEEIALPQRPRPKSKREKVKERFADLNPAPLNIDNKMHTVGAQDIAAGMEAYDPHERQDYLLTQHNERGQLLDGLEFIYPEYLQMINRGQAITPESIQEVKGKNSKEVQARHAQYVQRLEDGTIKPEVNTPPPPEYKKKRVVVKRIR